MCVCVCVVLLNMDGLNYNGKIVYFNHRRCGKWQMHVLRVTEMSGIWMESALNSIKQRGCKEGV